MSKRKGSMTLTRLILRAISGFTFGFIAFFISLPLIIILFPLLQWLEHGYFSVKDMIELIKDFYDEIFHLITLKELITCLK